MKSQSSTEFMIFIGIAIIILLSYFAIAHNYLELTYKQKDIISGQDFAKQIKNEINIASRVEDGYQRTFTLPNKIGNKEFTLHVEGREVVVTISEDNSDYVELLSANINTETFNPGDTIIITKIDGNVNIRSNEAPFEP